jgi:hypothetical protein
VRTPMTTYMRKSDKFFTEHLAAGSTVWKNVARRGC